MFTTDERVRKLTFTGSTAVGKMLAGRAAGNLKRVSVELGGHAPFIVFPDADPVHAAKGAAALKFLNSGQACISPNRLYVHESRHDAFVGTLVERVGTVRSRATGWTTASVSARSSTRLRLPRSHVRSTTPASTVPTCPSVEHRLTGDGFDAGHFYAPTLLTGVTDEMVIRREETFGPVAPVITYGDVDEVVWRWPTTRTTGSPPTCTPTEPVDGDAHLRGAAVRHHRHQRRQPDVGCGAVRWDGRLRARP